MTTLPVRAISTERLQVIVATLLRTSPDPRDPFLTEAIRRGLVTPLVDAVDSATATSGLTADAEE